jgi:Fic family protein
MKMKRPMPPPKLQDLIDEIDDGKLITAFVSPEISRPPGYLPWDELRYRPAPEGFTHKEWWAAVKLARNNSYRLLPLSDQKELPFRYTLPDEVLEAIEAINRDASGQITISEQVTNPATRNRYLVSSLMEEAITSSQLEGASTTRLVAREMIRSGREPRTRDERMIFNNYNAMRTVSEWRNQDLTIELLCEIHRVVTDGTLDNPEESGRFQLPDEVRVGVYGTDDELYYSPPPADQIPERVQRLCDFANGKLDSGYIPPLVKAITIHFMVGYEHPFVDGNGRTARILFYWAMLKYGYWLTEYLTISPILKKAPAKYARSYLHTEQDDDDLTYFLIYHLRVIRRAIKDLHEYLRRKMQEARDIQQSLTSIPRLFNPRELALLKHAAENSTAHYTVQSHMTSHDVSYETARQDLMSLESLALLTKGKLGRSLYWSPVPDLAEKLKKGTQTFSGETESSD